MVLESVFTLFIMEKKGNTVPHSPGPGNTILFLTVKLTSVGASLLGVESHIYLFDRII